MSRYVTRGGNTGGAEPALSGVEWAVQALQYTLSRDYGFSPCKSCNKTFFEMTWSLIVGEISFI